MTEDVSVVMATFNYGRYLERSVWSVLSQPVSELVVIDDCSTDDTEQVLQGIRDPRLHVIRLPENRGQAVALSTGLSAVRSNLVALLDSDDYFLPGKVDAIRRAAGASPESIFFYHPFVQADSDGIASAQSMQLISGDLRQRPRDLVRFKGQATSGIAIRKSAFEEILPIPEDLRFMADGWLVYLAPLMGAVLALPGHLAVYNLHGGNAFNFSERDVAKIQAKLAMQQSLERLLGEQVRARIESPQLADAYLFKHRQFTQALAAQLDEATPAQELRRHWSTLAYSVRHEREWRAFPRFGREVARQLGKPSGPGRRRAL